MRGNGLYSEAPVHLIGIGGVGMAGLARLLHQQGILVSGSDRSRNRLTGDLQRLGIEISDHHHRSAVPEEARWGIRTPAVPESNPELDALRSRNLPVFARGDVLASLANARSTIAVAGAHGKTTTSAMLLHVLRHCRGEAGYAIGGETAFPGRVADGGDPEMPFVVEADESDGTLMRYRPAVGVITHVEWDHVERFPTRRALLDCYRRFARQAGCLWIRAEDGDAETVCRGVDGVQRAGWGEMADLQMLEITSSSTGVRFRFQEDGRETTCRVPLPGEHNAWNALMALGAARDAGVEIREGAVSLESFAGVGRRFQTKSVNGVSIIQDYAHHPTELRAVLNSVAALEPRRIWVIFQPHRYSRTRHLLQEFAEALRPADHLALIPVYAAFEKPEQGADSGELAEACRQMHPDVGVWEDREALVREWSKEMRKGDVVLLAGAGDIENMWTAFGPATDSSILPEA